VENACAGAALLAMLALPLAEILTRRFLQAGVPGSTTLVQHLSLWVGFLGAAIAARDGKLLALATATFLRDGRGRHLVDIFRAAVTAAITALLFWGAVDLVVSEHQAGTRIGSFVPVWIAQAVLPVSLAAIAIRVVWQSSANGIGRLVAAAGLVAAGLLWRYPTLLAGVNAWPGLGVLLIAGICGAPIFALLGGTAVLLFLSDGFTPVAVLIETYALSVSPTLPAIPLFTLAGFLLAEGHASERLLRVFRAWFGWIPGGTAAVCALLCSFFTVFTGGSGVTILALGGVLYPALLREGYRDRFSLGLLTASGSLGLLLPPALPLILYAVVAERPIEDLFIGGIVPGILLTALIVGLGIREGVVSGAERSRFTLREAIAAALAAKWELALPGVVLASIFSGLATPVESAALTACYVLLVQTVVRRDISVRHDLLRVTTECTAIIGGVLVILGMAVGLTSYLVEAEVPGRLLEWTQVHIESPTLFLLALNLFLLVVGALMDIFSATVVVVPLIVPLGAAYGIHPVHLGIIFIANLELGYLVPPVGENLFLSAYRFKRSVLDVAGATLPMTCILAVGVLLITYVPWMTLGLLRILGRM
jgi:C4-dicarboxylate transporter, DctM subunit